MRPKAKTNPDYELFTATSFDNWENLPPDFIADLKKMEVESPRKYNRFVMNSDEDYDLEGAFYARLMSDALKQGRVDLDILFEPTAKVYTFWDLGIRASDTTVIWFVQFIMNEVWLIDYYENFGEGVEHYAARLRQHNYSYGCHYLPHDGKQRMQGRSIESRHEILEELTSDPVAIVIPHSVEERIQLTRSLIPSCRFSSKCERGVDCLNHYKKKKNEILSTEAKPVFAPQPLHDWSSNGADGFGVISIVRRYMEIDGEYLGQPTPTSFAQNHPLKRDQIANLLNV